MSNKQLHLQKNENVFSNVRWVVDVFLAFLKKGKYSKYCFLVNAVLKVARKKELPVLTDMHLLLGRYSLPFKINWHYWGYTMRLAH